MIVQMPGVKNLVNSFAFVPKTIIEIDQLIGQFQKMISAQVLDARRQEKSACAIDLIYADAMTFLNAIEQNAKKCPCQAVVIATLETGR